MLKRELRLNSRLEAARLILGRMKRDHSKLQTALAGAEYDLEVLDNIQGPSKVADNAATIKSWGVPGSKVKQRVTERAEDKAAEEKELFMALAGMFWYQIPVKLLAGNPRYHVIRDYLNRQAGKYGQFSDYKDALKALERQAREPGDEAQ